MVDDVDDPPPFLRALIGELSADQSDEEFDTTLDTAVESIHRASIT